MLAALLATVLIVGVLIILSILYEYIGSGYGVIPKSSLIDVARRIPEGTHIYIALNLANSSSILPNLLSELKAAITAVGYDRVFVSVFASFSTDGTDVMLLDFASWLTHRAIPNQIVTDGLNMGHKTRPPGMSRISWLSALRNSAMQPLISRSNVFWPSIDPNNIKVLFVNDIITTALDMLTLISAKDARYDAVCALDVYWSFYDTWVARDRNGYAFSSYYPYVRDVESQSKLRAGEPFPVRSCWNGMISMSAAPFLNHGVQFRAHINYSSSEELQCPIASECYLICKDFRDKGYDKIYVHPRVVVAYEQFFYDLHKSLQGILLRGVVSLFNFPCYRVAQWGKPFLPVDECLAETKSFRHNSMWVIVGIGILGIWTLSYRFTTRTAIRSARGFDHEKDP
jgi:hypothetical protein